jgi:hypothetical protein
MVPRGEKTMVPKRSLFVLMIAALTPPALAVTPLVGAQEGPKPKAFTLGRLTNRKSTRPATTASKIM